jgi:gamma-glutamylcysteine synthetase
MSQPESTSQNVLPTWVESSLIKGMLRGIERESLRMQSDGFQPVFQTGTTARYLIRWQVL